MRTRLGADFYADVQRDVAERLGSEGADAAVFDDADDVAYLTGFFHFPTERPVAVWISADPAAAVLLLVPELELDYARHQSAYAELVSYPEYPGVVPPFELLARRAGGRRRLGYAGTTTAARLDALDLAFPNVELLRVRAVDTARLVKRPAEVDLHREAARITDRMLAAGRELVEDAVRSGGPLPTEADLSSYVTKVGMSAMYDEHDDVVVVPHLAGGLVYSGPNSARPHALPSGQRLERGQVFMLSLGAAVGGRHVEGERTFVIGEPTADQQRYYTTTLRAHLTGLAGIRAGRSCAEINAECLDVVRTAGLGHLLRHRQGHGIGLNIHEPPWLEDGDASELRPNMIVSNEPGIYVPGHGGYRISDSVLVGTEGGRALTSYPKGLEDIVLAA
jgi:Xaa-Pro aminopeptidase